MFDGGKFVEVDDFQMGSAEIKMISCSAEKRLPSECLSLTMARVNMMQTQMTNHVIVIAVSPVSLKSSCVCVVWLKRQLKSINILLTCM